MFVVVFSFFSCCAMFQVPKFNQLLLQTAARAYDVDLISENPHAGAKVQELKKIWTFHDGKLNTQKFKTLKEEGHTQHRSKWLH